MLSTFILVISFILIFLLGICLTFWFVRWSLNKATVYIGAEYTNGYIDVCVDHLDKDIVYYFQTEVGEIETANRTDFVLQFKKKQ